ncbi:MAG TPA: gluconokinase, partial [Chthonomonadaceae bacterium]|nr:gluconokinase [Chthonomonadaceae bacterium]
DQALAQAGDRDASIHAVGTSTFWHALLGLDAQGEPLTPIYNWSDTRSAPAARRLRKDLDVEAVHARTGCVIHPSYYPAKLVWLRDTHPQIFARVARWVSPGEYLFSRLLGPDACRVSVSMASGTGLLNQQQCRWDTQTLEAIGLPLEKLSPLIDLKTAFSGLQGDYARRWPALREVPFFPAAGDGACGNMGSGCVSPQRMAINLGTSGAIRVLWEEDPQAPLTPPPGLWRYRVDARRPLMGAAFSDGGGDYAWMLRTLQLPPAEELEQQLTRMEPGAHDLIFLPFLAGERSPGWNPDAHAALTGMNLDTRPIDILAAALEAVALQFAQAAQQLAALFPQARQIVASGGALGHSPAWAQMFADAIGQPVTLAAEPEASARGAALLALESSGQISSAGEVEARLGRVFTPDPSRHARYLDLLARQQRLYAQLQAATHSTVSES